MQELDSISNLVAKLPGSVLRNVEFTIEHVIVEISSRNEFEDNEEELIIFKNIVQSDYIRVLSYLESFDLLPLELNLLRLHLHFLGGFDCEHFLGALVLGLVNHAVLTFSEFFFEFVKVENIRAA